MSGVIDSKGQQWERCNRCGRYVKFQSLRYERKSVKYQYGRDLCGRCYRITSIKKISVVA